MTLDRDKTELSGRFRYSRISYFIKILSVSEAILKCAFIMLIMLLSLWQEVDRLDHPKDVQFAKSKDMNIVVTVAEDCNLRIWDRSRPKTGMADNIKETSVGDFYNIQEFE